MAKRAKPAAARRRAASKFPNLRPGELVTLLDFVRYAVSRFTEAKLVFAHGTTDPVAEAAFLVNKIYMRGLPFYVDERVIVPRSFIGELLDSHFGGEGDGESGALMPDP